MLNNVDLTYQLNKIRNHVLSSEDKLLFEAKKLLKHDLYSDKQVLDNLTQYNKRFADLDEETLDEDKIYHLAEIKNLAISYRLKFLEKKLYKPEVPYIATLKIDHLNQLNRIEISYFKILTPAESFSNNKTEHSSLLFAKTNEGNYYLIHHWGKNLSWYRRWLYLPLKSFENLVLTVILTTLTLTLCLPTELITLDDKAEYWSGYRAAAFFHLLIFNFGVTVFFTFTLAKNFSNAIWNQLKDFG